MRTATRSAEVSAAHSYKGYKRLRDSENFQEIWRVCVPLTDGLFKESLSEVQEHTQGTKA